MTMTMTMTMTTIDRCSPRGWCMTVIVAVGFLVSGCTHGVDRIGTDSSTAAEPGGLDFVDKSTWVSDHPDPRGKPSDRFPDIALVDQSGKTHHFYRDLVKDRTVVIQFFYTTCTGI